MNARLALCGVIALGLGCAEAGQSRTRVPLFVAGSDVSTPILALGDVPLSITRADLAFGPLYLCAGASAGDLCDTARLEWLDTALIDTLKASPERVGELMGVTGPVRSFMYDLGISSQLTRDHPFVLEAARQLDDASFVVQGTAAVSGIELPFTAAVPIQQSDDTELGVPVIRKSTSEMFYRDVTRDEAGVVVRFTPDVWLRGLDFRPYVGDQSCVPGGPPLACSGTSELTCDEAGEQSSARDCSELGQVCLPGLGCAERLTLTPDSEAYRSLRNALAGAGRPSFEWDYDP